MKKIKVKIIKDYWDKEFLKQMKKDDIIEVLESRFEILKEKGLVEKVEEATKKGFINE